MEPGWVSPAAAMPQGCPGDTPTKGRARAGAASSTPLVPQGPIPTVPQQGPLPPWFVPHNQQLIPAQAESVAGISVPWRAAGHP